MEETARILDLKLQLLEIRDPNDFDRAFSAISKQRAHAFTLLRSPLVRRHQVQILDFTAKKRLPAMYPESGFVDAGGLMSYGENLADLWRRAAIYVDKILKGTKPAELPVEQPTRFELVINLRTAKQIGLTIPPNVLARADRVIK
jgi:putative ABC transport system substrate-binding protein